MRLGDLLGRKGINPRSLGARSCWRKRAHATMDDAEAQRLSLLAAHYVSLPEALRAYQCAECGAFHVGHLLDNDTRLMEPLG